MLRLALRGKKKYTLSLYEINKRSKSYSIKTVRFLRKKYKKDTEFFFIMGADSLKGLKRWKNINELNKLVKFTVFTRPGYQRRKIASNIISIRILGKDVSSTGIRKSIKNKRNIKNLVPKSVEIYINKKKMYIK